MPLVRLNKAPAVRPPSGALSELVGAFESETVAVFMRTAPVNERIVLHVVLAMLIVAVSLSAIVKLNRVVMGLGLITTSAGSLYVNPYDMGIVRQVHVKAGEVVKKGQPLATLDPTFTHADLVQLQQHLSSDEAAVAREEAELAGRPYHYSTTNLYESIQGGLWLKRQAQVQSDLASFDAQIKSADAQVAQYTSDADRYAKRLKLAVDAENVYQPLLEKGYVSKLQTMQATDERTEMSRLLADAQNEVAQYRQVSASLKAQRDSYIQKWHSDTATQLVLDRNDLDTTRDNLEKAQKLNDLTTLNSPADAIVLKVGKVSTGSVTGGATSAQGADQDPLFTLVPLSAPVEARVNVSSQDIGFIAVGDKVTIKLDAYMFLRHGTVTGVVKSISEGSFTTDDNNQPVTQPYFKVWVAIKKLNLRNVPKDFRLVPGMTLTGDIMVGERTILSYLMEGALRTGSEAMREPN
jgi:HlyD family type I secretion membrane fusion protein